MSAATTTTTKTTKRGANLDSERASLLGKIGGNMVVARYGGQAVARPMLAGLAASWLRKADPDGVLPMAERQQRAEALKRAHYARMSLARWGKSAPTKKAS